MPKNFVRGKVYNKALKQETMDFIYNSPYIVKRHLYRVNQMSESQTGIGLNYKMQDLLAIEHDFTNNQSNLNDFLNGGHFLADNWMESYTIGVEEKARFMANFPTLDEPDHISPAKSIFIQNTLTERVDGIFISWYEEYIERFYLYLNSYQVFIPFPKSAS